MHLPDPLQGRKHPHFTPKNCLCLMEWIKQNGWGILSIHWWVVYQTLYNGSVTSVCRGLSRKICSSKVQGLYIFFLSIIELHFFFEQFGNSLYLKIKINYFYWVLKYYHLSLRRHYLALARATSVINIWYNLVSICPICLYTWHHRNLGQHSLFPCHSTSHGSYGTWDQLNPHLPVENF